MYTYVCKCKNDKIKNIYTVDNSSSFNTNISDTEKDKCQSKGFVSKRVYT
jgi:hypothetical protein